MGRYQIEGDYVSFPGYYRNHTLGTFTEKPAFEGTIFDPQNWVNGEYISPEQQRMNSDVIAYQRYMEEKSNPSNQQHREENKEPDIEKTSKKEKKKKTKGDRSKQKETREERAARQEKRGVKTKGVHTPPDNTKMSKEEIAAKKAELVESGALERLRKRKPKQYEAFIKKYPHWANGNVGKSGKVGKLFRGGRKGWIAALLALFAIGTTTTICAYNSGKKSSNSAVHLADTESSSSSSSSSKSSETKSSNSDGESKGSSVNGTDWTAIQRVWAYA